MREPDGRSRRCFLKASSMLGLAAAFMPPTIGEAFADSRIAGFSKRRQRSSRQTLNTFRKRDPGAIRKSRSTSRLPITNPEPGQITSGLPTIQGLSHGGPNRNI
jgi:hypothetical protein